MRTFKIALAIFALTAVIPMLWACGSSVPGDRETAKPQKKEGIGGHSALKREGRITVGFSIASFQEERWLTDRDIFISRCSELGADVIVQSANGDAELQEEQCKKLLAQKIDVLVVIPQDSEKAAEIVNEANKSNTPVVAYDRLIRNCALDAYVTYDNIKIGELQAEHLVRKAPEGNYVLLGGARTDYCSIQLREGQMKVLKPYIDRGTIRIVGDEWVKDWNPYEARKIIERTLAENNNNIKAVVASNDGTAGGAIQALAERKLAGKVYVSGQDADLAGCQRIVEGTQSMTVYVPTKAEAEGSAEVAIRLAQGEKFAGNSTTENGKASIPTLLLPPTPVDRENIVDTVIKDGYQKLEEVFKNTPKDQWPRQK